MTADQQVAESIADFLLAGRAPPVTIGADPAEPDGRYSSASCPTLADARSWLIREALAGKTVYIHFTGGSLGQSIAGVRHLEQRR
jgi:hypothetical protein